MEPENRVDEFVSLYSQNTRAIYSYIHSLVTQQADADDVFQETCRVLWERFGDFRRDGDFRRWAFGIAHIKVLQLRDRQGSSKLVFSPEMIELLDQSIASAAAGTDARSAALAECVQRLKPDDRALVDARYRVGVSVQDLAASSQLSLHAAYRALRRIHQQLFECMRRVQAENER